MLQYRLAEVELGISGQLAGHVPAVGTSWAVAMDDVCHRVDLAPADDGFTARIDGRDLALEGDWRPGQSLFRGRIDGRARTVQVDRNGTHWILSHGGGEVTALVMTPRAAELAAKMPKKQPPDLSRFLLSPMPGLLVSLAVEECQKVRTGEELAVVEAMKMENVLRAERDGRIAKLHAEPGAHLSVDQAILEFE